MPAGEPVAVVQMANDKRIRTQSKEEKYLFSLDFKRFQRLNVSGFWRERVNFPSIRRFLLRLGTIQWQVTAWIYF